MTLREPPKSAVFSTDTPEPETDRDDIETALPNAVAIPQEAIEPATRFPEIEIFPNDFASSLSEIETFDPKQAFELTERIPSVHASERDDRFPSACIFPVTLRLPLKQVFPTASGYTTDLNEVRPATLKSLPQTVLEETDKALLIMQLAAREKLAPTFRVDDEDAVDPTKRQRVTLTEDPTATLDFADIFVPTITVEPTVRALPKIALFEVDRCVISLQSTDPPTDRELPTTTFLNADKELPIQASVPIVSVGEAMRSFTDN